MLGRNAQNVGAGFYLTWVYMADKNADFILYSRYEGLPSNASAEIDFVDTTETTSIISEMKLSSSTKKRKSPSIDELANQQLSSFTTKAERTLDKLMLEFGDNEKKVDVDMEITEKRHKIRTYIGSLDEQIEKKKDKIRSVKKKSRKQFRMDLIPRKRKL